MLKSEPKHSGFKTKLALRKQLPPPRKPIRLAAAYLLLASLCGCSIFSSAALTTTDTLKNTAVATKEVLHSKTLHYLGNSDLEYYKDVATQIDYTHVYQEEDNRAVQTEPPRRIRHPREDEIIDITLADAIHRALSNSDVIRDRGQFLSPGNVILNSPQQAASVFDPGIQETGILLGNRGVEAALADFDANLTVNSLWGRNEQIQNNRFAAGAQPGTTLTEDSANVTAQIEKQMANGDIFSINQSVIYSSNNIPVQQSGRLFGSVYTGNVQAQYRHPLLSGGGVEFNRIAGPAASNPLRVSGVNQGVVIARINNDISVADFESSVRNLLKDVEDLYWELALAYRAYDAEIVARNSNLKVWRKTKVQFEGGNQARADEAQAREAFFDSRSRAEDALARIYSTESELRRLLGMVVNDGFILRPVDEPSTAEFLPDWHICLAEALTNRVELRRQKWTVKSLELQLKAARTLVRPRLDFVSRYQVNMFGDHLLRYNDNDSASPPTAQGLNSAYETMTQGDQTGWNLGLEFSMPIGFRTAHSQVRNLELQLAKSRKVLGVQELEVSHELARAFQELDRAYQTAQSNFNRRRAAELRVQAEQIKVDLGLGNAQTQNAVDLLLRAQISLAQAEVAYYSSLIAYNQAITAIHYRKGSLLEFNSVELAESGWDPQAYLLALRRSWARSHALDASPLLHTEPGEFVTGPEEINLLMPAEESTPLMNLEGTPTEDSAPVPTLGVPPVPTPIYEEAETPLSPTPIDEEPAAPINPAPAYEEPEIPLLPAPDYEPIRIDASAGKGWRKSDRDQSQGTSEPRLELVPQPRSPLDRPLR